MTRPLEFHRFFIVGGNMGILSRRFAQIKKEKEMIRSIDLVDQINFFREQEGKKKNKNHKKLTEEIREYNKVAKKIDTPQIGHIFYTDSMNRKQKCYLLSNIQAKMFMAKESFIVQILIEKDFEKLKLENNIHNESIIHTKETHDEIKLLVEQLDWDVKKYGMLNKEINSLVALKFDIDTGLRKSDMNSEQAEYRALVEEKYIENIKKTKKHGGTKKIVKEILGL